MRGEFIGAPQRGAGARPVIGLVERAAAHQLDLPLLLPVLVAPQGERVAEGLGGLALPAHLAVKLAEPQPVGLGGAARFRRLAGKRERPFLLVAVAEQADAGVARRERERIAGRDIVEYADRGGMLVLAGQQFGGDQPGLRALRVEPGREPREDRGERAHLLPAKIEREPDHQFRRAGFGGAKPGRDRAIGLDQGAHVPDGRRLGIEHGERGLALMAGGEDGGRADPEPDAARSGRAGGREHLGLALGPGERDQQHRAMLGGIACCRPGRSGGGQSSERIALVRPVSQPGPEHGDGEADALVPLDRVDLGAGGAPVMGAEGLGDEQEAAVDRQGVLPLQRAGAVEREPPIAGDDAVPHRLAGNRLVRRRGGEGRGIARARPVIGAVEGGHPCLGIRDERRAGLDPGRGGRGAEQGGGGKSGAGEQPTYLDNWGLHRLRARPS